MSVKTAQRFNRAYKVANWQDIQRIYYTATLSAFIHSWALVILSILIPSALTVLQFLAALNRASKNGYSGCAVAYELLAPRIALSTGRKCSIRTLERGLAFLKKVGLVQLTWWTMPDKIIRNGIFEHKVAGTARIETSDGWRSQQIRVIVLTERGLALWDKATCGKGSVYIPHFAPFITPAKLAANPKKDQVGKPTMIKSLRSMSESSMGYCKNIKKLGQTTCAMAQPSPCEHVAFTPSQSTTSHDVDSNQSEPAISPVLQVDRPEINSSESKNGLQNSQIQCQSEVPSSVQAAPHPQIPQNAKRRRTEIPRGCTHTSPPIPKNSTNKTTWPVARAYILAELHKALCNFSTHEANQIYERALYELSPEYPSGFPTIIDWAYWVARFALLSPDQRRGHMFRDILPLLRARFVPVPRERSQFKEYKYAKGPMPDHISTELDPFLQGLWSKFVK